MCAFQKYPYEYNKVKYASKYVHLNISRYSAVSNAEAKLRDGLEVIDHCSI